jgi:hypothetical protein
MNKRHRRCRFIVCGRAAQSLGAGPILAIPQQMYSGVRVNIDTTIIAASAILTVVSIVLMSAPMVMRNREKI